MIKRLFLCLMAQLVFTSQGHAQSLMDYERFHSQSEFAVAKTDNIVYAKAKTHYYKYTGRGSNTQKSSYDLITQIPLTLDLYNPNTASKPGRRAVLILIPGGGRTGCLNVSQCDQKTVKQSGLYAGDAYYISQEGTNYNETANTKASTFAKSGFLVLTLNTRYTYHDKRYEKGQTHRWKNNGSPILNSGGAHLENLVVDVKRAIRWISHPSRANTYNIDPDNIFIQGGSGAAKMASLAATTPENTFLADSPHDSQVGSAGYLFEVNNNNLLVPQKSLRGAILFAGDMNGTKHRSLISANTGALMFWHGTKDRSVLHGLAETMEQRCEDVGCSTQFYSLANIQHGSQGSAKFEHTDRISNSAGLRTGVHAHLHDFIVNHLDSGTDNRPHLSINSSKVTFNEASGRADIEINLSRAVSHNVRFTASADQTREVMSGLGTQGNYTLIEKYVAKDKLTTGPVAYDQGTGVAFEDVNNVTNKYKGQTYHNNGPGNGNPLVISSSSSYFTNDFESKKQIITIAAGQTKASFSVNLFNDTIYEQNECFKVRLLNADGARITNSVEMITIIDDDNPNAGTSIPTVCKNPVSNVITDNDIDKPTITINSPSKTGSGPIADIIITISDNQSIIASDVLVDYESSTTTSDFICNQTNVSQVNCTITVLDSGNLVLVATDQAGNVTVAQENNYTINVPEIDTTKPIMSINAPTKSSNSAIMDTSIRIVDNISVSADNVELRSDNSANVSNLNCINTSVKIVDCIIRINSSGDLKLRVTDDAGNTHNKNENNYVITPLDRLWIKIISPTKVKTGAITDTIIYVQSDAPILASNVKLRADTTAAVSNYNCSQISNNRISCTIIISSSGALKIKATNQSGMQTQKIEYGYVIN